jgi:hypothetical protein
LQSVIGRATNAAVEKWDCGSIRPACVSSQANRSKAAAYQITGKFTRQERRRPSQVAVPRADILLGPVAG